MKPQKNSKALSKLCFCGKRSNRTALLCLALTILALFPAVGYSLKSDRSKPLSIESDKAAINSKSGISIYTGHVIVNQGSTHLHANRLEVHLDTNSKLIEAIATGTPAHYSEIPSPGKPIVYASAKIMHYLAKKNKLILIGNAVITQKANVFKGPKIEYNTKTGEVISDASQKGRTTIIFTPKN